MKKSILSTTLFLFFVAVTHAQTADTRRPSNNPTVNGPLIDAREVGDPTLASGKGNTPANKQVTNDVAALKAMSSTGAFTFTGYQLELINPIVHLPSSSTTQIGRIKIVDVRADPYKVGFKPVDYLQKKKGVGSVALQVNQGMHKWLQDDVLGKFIAIDSNSNRQLVLVINNCWLSNEAHYPYTGARSPLTNVLHYDITMYSSLGYGYFPQKRVAGSFNRIYQANENGTVLFDSLAQLICKEISTIDFIAKEKDEKLVSIADFNSFYNSQKNKLNNIISPAKGIYRTYEDFLAQQVASDSVEMIIKYDNAGRSAMYACQLMQFNHTDPESTSKSWGYSDGKTLFVNIGNGFFVRLVRSGGNYIFYWLNNMREDRIKASVSNGIILGNSTFDIIKDYSRVTPLTYQLDALTGKLN